jgi:hypothetical protein
MSRGPAGASRESGRSQRQPSNAARPRNRGGEGKRRTRIELASPAWKAGALPLSYRRTGEAAPFGGAASMTVCTNDLALCHLVEDASPSAVPESGSDADCLSRRWSNSSTTGSVFRSRCMDARADRRPGTRSVPRSTLACVCRRVRCIALDWPRSVLACTRLDKAGNSCLAVPWIFDARRSRRLAFRAHNAHISAFFRPY